MYTKTDLLNIKNLIAYLKHNIPFYSKKIPSIFNIDDDESIIEYFLSLPIINKKVIKSDYSSFLSKEFCLKNEMAVRYFIDSDNGNISEEDINTISKEGVFIERTSGSTGIPFYCIKTLSERIKLGRNLWSFRRRITTNIKDSDLYCFIHNDQITKDLLSYSIEEQLKYLGEYRWWHTNLAWIKKLYSYLKENSIKYNSMLQVIENNGRFISDEEKIEYGHWFNCKVVNYYGCREIWAIAYDCKEGYLHIDADNVLVELIDDNGQLIDKEGIVGNIVITSFSLRSMPIVRYKIGDIGLIVPGKCLCGSNAKRIKLLEGRSSQRIYGEKDVFGNVLFSRVVGRLIYTYKLNKFNSIFVEQVDEESFIVYIYDNKEDKNLFEQRFIELAQQLLSKKYKFEFKYMDGTREDTKDIIFISRCYL